jgi:hypothetical protein
MKKSTSCGPIKNLSPLLKGKWCHRKRMKNDYIKLHVVPLKLIRIPRFGYVVAVHILYESRLEGGGVNRAKLKFTKLITTTSRVSVRSIIESEREGAKQIASE